MAYLSWIDDESLKDIVGKILSTAERIMVSSERHFEKNVIDPFSAMFQMAGFGIGYKLWHTSETTRQAQKSLQNHVGDFHQNVLGSVKGWHNFGTGNIVDIECPDRKIIAEIKNKFNTVKGANLSDLYDMLEKSVMYKSSKHRGYTAYYVTIIPKKPERFNVMFTPSDKSIGKRKPENEQIRMIDGASFYDLVTGTDGALYQLYSVLPQVISDVGKKRFNNEQFEGLNKYFEAAFG